MILKLSDVQIGKPSIPSSWSNSQQKYLDEDPREVFLDTIKGELFDTREEMKVDSKQRKVLMESIINIDDSLGVGSQYFHSNYLVYLEKCWGDHLGIVLTPDIVWYTILSEVAYIVKAFPEKYRHLFSDSPDKKRITILGCGHTMPMEDLIQNLRKLAPMDTSLFFPELDNTKNSKLAFYTAFSDICSPYYDYCMLCCGFPYIDVRGTLDEWELINKHWESLKNLIHNENWVNSVTKVLSSILKNFTGVGFWKEIFSVEKCGSGHQTVVSGWFTDLFVEQPRLRYTSNFSTHISRISYEQISDKKHYEMHVGLFNSYQKDEFMEPGFSSLIYDVTSYKGLVGK